MISPELIIGVEVIHLNEYKFDKRKLLVIKRTPKKRRISFGGRNKVMVEGYDKHTLWDVSGPNVTRIGVETSTVIVVMDLEGHTTFEFVTQDISRLTQVVAQLQNKLVDVHKQNEEMKQRDMSELWTSLLA